MLIGKNWKIESDDMNVILMDLHKSKKGEESWEIEGYYPTVKEALHGLVELEIKSTELKDLQTVCDKIMVLHYLIDTIKEVAVEEKVAAVQ